ncbi:MAG: transcription antitermination factor NusB [Ilumatobacteraceae bacterium]
MSDDPRRVALTLLRRIEDEGAFANLVVPSTLDRSDLSRSDRAMVTDLVYGTTRLRRACDALVDRHISSPPDAATRRILRLGAYQWGWGGVPAHAAVHETVSLAPRRVRGFVNAILRRTVEGPPPSDLKWPSLASQLSVPDWIYDLYVDEVGAEAAVASLARMNVPPAPVVRDDGYVQDRASTWVAAAVGAQPGELILDLCAAPGGKATALAAAGATVVAADLRTQRAGLIAENAQRLGFSSDQLSVIAADGTLPPFAESQFDAVLLDAPCSGLGALRRRPDSRWRVEPRDVDVLSSLQQSLIDSATALVKPGGRFVYSVCTINASESIDHGMPSGWEVDDAPPEGQWQRFDHGWRVLPHDADTDGMVLMRYRRLA